MSQPLAFLHDWVFALLIEGIAVVVAAGLAWRRGKTRHQAGLFYAHVNVFLIQTLDDRERGVRLETDRACSSLPLEQVIHHLGGEVLTQLRGGGPILARIPPGAIAKLRESALVERVEVSSVISLRAWPGT